MHLHKHLPELVTLFLEVVGRLKKREARPEELKDFIEKLHAFNTGTAAERKYILTQDLGNQPEQFFRLFVEGWELRAEPAGRIAAQKRNEINAAARELIERFRKIPSETFWS